MADDNRGAHELIADRAPPQARYTSAAAKRASLTTVPVAGSRRGGADPALAKHVQSCTGRLSLREPGCPARSTIRLAGRYHVGGRLAGAELHTRN
jgi:hypothetical protein